MKVFVPGNESAVAWGVLLFVLLINAAISLVLYLLK